MEGCILRLVDMIPESGADASRIVDEKSVDSGSKRAILADAILVVYWILAIGRAAWISEFGVNASSELGAVHLGSLGMLAAVAILLLTIPSRYGWARPLTVAVLALIGAGLFLFNITSLLGRATHASAISIPYLGLFCVQNLDFQCVARYSYVAEALTVLLIGMIALFWVCHPPLRRRALQTRDRMEALLPAWLPPRPLLAGFCCVFAIWQIESWPRFVEPEPMQHFLFAPFEMGPIELVTKRRAHYRVPPVVVAHPRPLMIITVDALRSDKVGLNANGPTLTPFLRSLAASGRLHDFGPAYATCTSSYCGITATIASASWATQQDGPPVPIADVLGGAGYRSYLLLSGIHRGWFNLAEIYGSHVDVMLNDSNRPAARWDDDYALVDEFRRLRLTDPQRSFFFLHLMSAHISGQKRKSAAPIITHSWPLATSAQEAEAYSSRYDIGVAQADDVIRLIFADLKRRGLLDDIVVAITADHAERLASGSPLGHAGEPDRQVSSIPLLIYDGRVGRYPARRLTSHLDAAPTLLHAIGVPAPASWEGIPLQEPSTRRAVPVDSLRRIGAAVEEGGRTLLYTCRWQSGREDIEDLGGASVSPDLREGAIAQGRALRAGLPHRRERPCRT